MATLSSGCLHLASKNVTAHDSTKPGHEVGDEVCTVQTTVERDEIHQLGVRGMHGRFVPVEKIVGKRNGRTSTKPYIVRPDADMVRYCSKCIILSNHLILDRSPNIGPLISRLELDKFKKVVYTGVCTVHGASSSNWCVP